MQDRVTVKMLQHLIDRLNDTTGAAREPWARQPDGTFRANLGAHYLDAAYGGVNLARMTTEGGGIACPLGSGMRPKRELYAALSAYLAGMELAQARAKA